MASLNIIHIFEEIIRLTIKLASFAIEQAQNSRNGGLLTCLLPFIHISPRTLFVVTSTNFKEKTHDESTQKPCILLDLVSSAKESQEKLEKELFREKKETNYQEFARQLADTLGGVLNCGKVPVLENKFLIHIEVAPVFSRYRSLFDHLFQCLYVDKAKKYNVLTKALDIFEKIKLVLRANIRENRTISTILKLKKKRKADSVNRSLDKNKKKLKEVISKITSPKTTTWDLDIHKKLLLLVSNENLDDNILFLFQMIEEEALQDFKNSSTSSEKKNESVLKMVKLGLLLHSIFLNLKPNFFSFFVATVQKFYDHTELRGTFYPPYLKNQIAYLYHSAKFYSQNLVRLPSTFLFNSKGKEMKIWNADHFESLKTISLNIKNAREVQKELLKVLESDPANETLWNLFIFLQSEIEEELKRCLCFSAICIGEGRERDILNWNSLQKELKSTYLISSLVYVEFSHVLGKFNEFIPLSALENQSEHFLGVSLKATLESLNKEFDLETLKKVVDEKKESLNEFLRKLNQQSGNKCGILFSEKKTSPNAFPFIVPNQSEEEPFTRKYSNTSDKFYSEMEEIVTEIEKGFDILIPLEEIEIQEGIKARGTAGEIQLGEWLGNSVALKKMDFPTDQNFAKYLMREIKISFANRPHPNIMKIYGVSFDEEESKVILVSQYYEGGNLFDRIGRKPAPKLETKVKILNDVAMGMLALHESHPEPIIHRDLKTLNVVFDKDPDTNSRYNMVIIDYGFSKSLAPSDKSSTDSDLEMGTVCYWSPKLVLNPGKASKEDDVYAYGVTSPFIRERKSLLVFLWRIDLDVRGSSLEPAMGRSNP